MTRASPQGPAPQVAVVSGSGLDLTGLLDETGEERPFETVPGLAHGTVPGHVCRFTHGHCGGLPMVLQRGRLHLYEGPGYAAVVRTVDALYAWGVRTVLFTNVVGGLRPAMRPGDLVAIDRVDLWRCARWSNQPASLSPDFQVSGCAFSGIYHWMPGPCYETPAEIAALQHLGAGVVGMSTAPELARCRELGLRAGIVSCVTNSCCRPQVLTHDHVVAIAREASADLTALIRQALPALVERNGGQSDRG